MLDRFSRSMQLIKACTSVLRQEKQLLVFPLISACSMLIVIAAFALPAFGLGALDRLDAMGERGDKLALLGAFAFYVVQYFVIFYFNAALVGATLMRLDGGSPSVGDGLRIANSRIGAILGYAIIAATVGMVLRMIQERVGFIGRLIVAALGVGWSVATYLVVPTLVATEAGPIDAIRDSAGMLKRTWGENVIGQGAMSLAFTVIGLGIGALGLGLIGLGVMANSVALIGLAIVAMVLALLTLMLFQTTLAGIYAAALYRFASTGSASAGFDNAALSVAFVRKS